jgi:hypothetical protein
VRSSLPSRASVPYRPAWGLSPSFVPVTDQSAVAEVGFDLANRRLGRRRRREYASPVGIEYSQPIRWRIHRRSLLQRRHRFSSRSFGQSLTRSHTDWELTSLPSPQRKRPGRDRSQIGGSIVSQLLNSSSQK